MKWRGRSWEDLRPRVITSAVLTTVGVVVVYAGGTLFALAAAVAVAVMLWELSTMLAPSKGSEALQIALLGAAALLLARFLPPIFTLPLLAAPAIVGASLLKKHIAIFLGFGFATLVFGHGMVWAREVHGLVWLLWLIFTIVATDVAGYFGGRSLGGPKFWPAVSPKKTWSGVVCGWIAAALVSLIFLRITDAGRDLIWISVLLSFASQLGDIAESAVKRKMNVKDSSNLLPGHGGLLDRFDGLMGGALFMLLVAQIVDVPDLIL
ncbi:phosphatidate cytidylyltransferase [Psychromarinibacter halotolerans]|uniref:Phosphatidate cytidylyltransferase n=1 Tax=Psychromarinibacter halotolerans TaxID=1775175 RepID=A0ABV7GQC2_9RHOB|nr:phosphatidate cytidylyltransferase [Psychromarinibacter halotolerans]MAQ82436.1 phosphatidate cytidylyltransferase [Maritimibacter sp.]MDF0594870.1 phosphatidate cytidylyltransferase [Psychromarinibacter halotolerans]